MPSTQVNSAVQIQHLPIGFADGYSGQATKFNKARKACKDGSLTTKTQRAEREQRAAAEKAKRVSTLDKLEALLADDNQDPETKQRLKLINKDLRSLGVLNRTQRRFIRKLYKAA